MVDNLTELPIDVWSLVGGFLNLDDVLYGLRLVSKTFYEVSCQDSFWESLFKAHCTEAEFELLRMVAQPKIIKGKITLVSEGAAGDWNRVLWSQCYKWALVAARHQPPSRVSAYLRVRPHLPQEAAALKKPGTQGLLPIVRNATLLFDCGTQITPTNLEIINSQQTEDQNDVYEKIGAKMVHTLLHERKNCCAIAYGASGTGKSHTLFGNSDAEEGLAPRCIRALFEKGKWFNEVNVEVFDVCKEEVRDLLAEGDVPPTCRVRFALPTGAKIENLTQKPARTFVEWGSLVQQSLNKQQRSAENLTRKVAPSPKNFLFVKTTCRRGNEEASIVFCKLSGSQRARRTGAATGLQLMEGQNINFNLGLNNLGQVIHQLVKTQQQQRMAKNEGGDGAASKKKLAKTMPPIPYRASKVTMLLQHVLAPPHHDAAKASWQLHVIGTCSPCLALEEEETMATCRFVDRWGELE